VLTSIARWLLAHSSLQGHYENCGATIADHCNSAVHIQFRSFSNYTDILELYFAPIWSTFWLSRARECTLISFCTPSPDKEHILKIDIALSCADLQDERCHLVEAKKFEGSM
jgi:hypothetical protein